MIGYFAKVSFIYGLLISIFLTIIIYIINFNTLNILVFMELFFNIGLIYIIFFSALSLFSTAIFLIESKILANNTRINYKFYLISSCISFSIIFNLYLSFNPLLKWLDRVRPWVNYASIIGNLILIILFITFLKLFYNLIYFFNIDWKRVGIYLFINIILLVPFLIYFTNDAKMHPEKKLSNYFKFLNNKEFKEKWNFYDIKETNLYIFGLDSADWNVILILIQEGYLPNIEYLIRNGSYGYLDNTNLSRSPGIWASIVTGMHYKKTKIYQSGEILNLTKRIITFFPILHKGGDSFFAVQKFMSFTRIPVLRKIFKANSLTQKYKYIWNYLNHYQIPILSIDVMTTWPPEKVNGGIFYFTELANCYPEYLNNYSIPLVGKYILLNELKKNTGYKLLKNFEIDKFNSAKLLAEKIKHRFAMYYTHGLDTINHVYWDFCYNGFLIKPKNIDEPTFKSHLINSKISDMYILYDRMIGELFNYNYSNIMVISDHGFSYDGYQHVLGNNGVFILSGKNIKRNNFIKDFSILDIFPTVSYLYQIGIPKYLDGKLNQKVFTKEFLGNNKPKYINIPESMKFRKIKSINNLIFDKKEIEKLKSLGYIQ